MLRKKFFYCFCIQGFQKYVTTVGSKSFLVLFFKIACFHQTLIMHPLHYFIASYLCASTLYSFCTVIWKIALPCLHLIMVYNRSSLYGGNTNKPMLIMVPCLQLILFDISMCIYCFIPFFGADFSLYNM
ncbi:hypothetical protein VPH35_044471 [Triticum aestivum]